jgi:hypothetical protein
LTLDQFRELCQHEWADRCGDVTGLSLTGESRAELAGEIVDDADVRFIHEMPADFGPQRLGVLVTEIANPVTRSVVRVSGADSVDLVHVARPVPA